MFASLKIRRHRMLDADKSRYRIYTQGGEFMTLEARTAYEAFKASGMKEASRIVRVSKYVSPAVDSSELASEVDYVSIAYLEGEAPPPPYNAAQPKPAPKPAVEAPAKAKPAETIISAPPETGAPPITTSPDSVNTMSFEAMEPTPMPAPDDGFEEILPISTPVPFKSAAPKTKAKPGAAPQPAPDRTTLTSAEIDKLLGDK